MNRQHFEYQVERLTETYGANNYKSERLKLIWNEVEDFSNEWFTGVVDRMIGEEKYAPLVTHFREAAIEERDRVYKLQKAQHTKDAHEFMSRYSGEDIQTICGQIRDRVQGKMNDQDFGTFVKMITPAVERQPRCSRCEDTKVYFDGKGMTLCNHN